MAMFPSFCRARSWWATGRERSFFASLLSDCGRLWTTYFASGRLVGGFGEEGIDKSGSDSVSGVIVASANSIQSSNSNRQSATASVTDSQNIDSTHL